VRVVFERCVNADDRRFREGAAVDIFDSRDRCRQRRRDTFGAIVCGGLKMDAGIGREGGKPRRFMEFGTQGGTQIRPQREGDQRRRAHKNQKPDDHASHVAPRAQDAGLQARGARRACYAACAFAIISTKR
jgi:hypothetical protein